MKPAHGEAKNDLKQHFLTVKLRKIIYKGIQSQKGVRHFKNLKHSLTYVKGALISLLVHILLPLQKSIYLFLIPDSR